KSYHVRAKHTDLHSGVEATSLESSHSLCTTTGGPLGGASVSTWATLLTPAPWIILVLLRMPAGSNRLNPRRAASTARATCDSIAHAISLLKTCQCAEPMDIR